MKKRMGLVVIMLAALLVASGCQSGGTVEPSKGSAARTYYESLNLATPEDAVRTFVNAFQREDFMTVYLVFDAKAQLQLQAENAKTFRWRHLIGENADKGVYDDLDYRGLSKISMDFWYFFDQIMLYAANKDDLLIDLRGGLDILRREDSTTREGGKAMDVIANVEGVKDEVVFRLVTDKDGRWRVYLVSAPGEGVDSWPSTLLDKSP